VNADRVKLYWDWKVRIIQKIRDSLSEVHSRGAYIGDLHPSNIVISGDENIFFVDLEDAGLLSEAYLGASMAADGFQAPSAKNGAQADLEALNKIELMMLHPTTAMLGRFPEKTGDILEAASEFFPRADLGKLNSEMPSLPLHFRARNANANHTQEHLVKVISDGILSRFDEARTERPLPLDPRVDAFGHASLGYGLSGVVLALAAAKIDIPDEMIRWLMQSLQSDDALTGAGLMDGHVGVALALVKCGRFDEATNVFDDFVASEKLPNNDSLSSGLSGLVFAANYIFDTTGHTAAKHFAEEICAIVLDNALRDRVRLERFGLGLLSGYSGVAFVLAQEYQRRPVSDLLKCSTNVLQKEIQNGVYNSDGSFHLAEGTKKLPYLNRGSAGVGVAISEILKSQQDAELKKLSDCIQLCFKIPFVLQPGLFEGRAGLLHVATLMDAAFDSGAQVNRLNIHLVQTKGHAAILGRGITRISDDLGCGSAGVLLALAGLRRPSLFCL